MHSRQRPLSPTSLCVQPAAAKRGAFAGLATPVVRASTVVFPDAASFDGRYADFYDGYTYGLFGTPTSRALEDQLCAISSASHCLLVPSGQAALSLVLMTFLKPGDHVLITDSCYGPIRAFATEWLAAWGVSVTFYDPLLGAQISNLLTPATRLVLVESPGSNTMEIQDIPAISRAAHAHGALLLGDMTWATPFHCDALTLGVDLVVDALSKYAGGHGDVLMGAISTKNEALYRRLKDMTRVVGIGVSPDDCSLVLRGLQTMPLRLERSSQSALTIARHLAARPEIDAVLHPALPDFPGNALWKRDFTGASGVFSLLLKSTYKGRENEVVDALKLFAIGASWGSARSVVAPQDPTGGRTATRWAGGKIIRLSIGLETVEDLIADLDQALDQLSKPQIRNITEHANLVADPASRPAA
jgi:cysteine-S-conjugate beta-lyase